MPRKKRQQRRDWGTGSVLRREDGKANLRWNENGKPRIKKGVPGDLADKLLRDIMARVQAGKAGIVGIDRTYKNVDEYADHFFDVRTTANNSDEQATYNLHLKPIVGHLPPTAINATFIRDNIIRHLKRTRSVLARNKGDLLSGSYVKNMVRLLSSMFSDMCEDGLIEFNPFKFISKKTQKLFRSNYDPKTGPWLKDPKLIEQFIATMGEDTDDFFAVGVMTGMRPAEVRGLDWKHIDWDRKKVSVQQQFSERENCLTSTKDRDSRDVPLLAELYPILRKRWERAGRPSDGIVFGPSAGRSSRAAQKREWMKDYYLAHSRDKFPTIKDAAAALAKAFDGEQVYFRDHMDIRNEVRGKKRRLLAVVPNSEAEATNKRKRRSWTDFDYISMAVVRKEWHKACTALGVPRMRLYDGTRHTFATQWVVSGGTGSERELQDLLGHTDQKVTERYVHMAKDYKGEHNRKLFGVDHAAISKAIASKELGLKWRIEGRPEPAPPEEDDEYADEEDAI